MAYIITRNKRTGYVQMVEKARVNGDSRTVAYVCGLGSMSQEEFKKFQKWAHSMKDQEMRKARVLACDVAVIESKTAEGKVAGEKQKKTTVKRAPKKKPIVKIDVVAKEKERKAQRERYEKKHGIKKTKRVVSTTGIRFTGRKSISEKKRILNERITEVGYRIANEKADIVGWHRERTGAWKIAPAQQIVKDYEGVLKTLKKQRSEMRR